MKKTLLCLVLALVICLSLCACGSPSNPLVGVWVANQASDFSDHNVVVTFDQKGKLEMLINSYSSTEYTLEDNAITSDFTLGINPITTEIQWLGENEIKIPIDRLGPENGLYLKKLPKGYKFQMPGEWTSLVTRYPMPIAGVGAMSMTVSEDGTVVVTGKNEQGEMQTAETTCSLSEDHQTVQFGSDPEGRFTIKPICPYVLFMENSKGTAVFFYQTALNALG